MRGKRDLKVGISMALLLVTFIANFLLACLGAGYLLNSQGVCSVPAGFFIYLCITAFITLICVIVFIKESGEE